MTLNDFFANIGESLDNVMTRIKKEERIVRYLGLFLQDTSFGELEAAFANNDAQTAFRAAHTLKGVSSNLGFDKLSAASSILTEDLRPLSFTDKSKGLYDEVKAIYDNIITNIRAFQA